MLRSILVPLDGSAAAEHALPYALAIARRTAGSVQLVHACAPLRAAGRTTAEIEEQHAHARAYLSSLGAPLSERWEVPMESLVLDGPPVAAIGAYAATGAADMIVMTTHGRGALSRLWLGSVADSLVRRSHLPMLLARPHGEPVDLLESVYDQPFQRVLVALDGSELAERALGPALELSAAMGAAVTLLQVIETPVVSAGSAVKAEHLDERALALWRSEAAGYLRELADAAAGRARSVDTCVLAGQPASAILEYARRHAVDLIALATHGRAGVRRMILGSVADKLVRGALSPVLVYGPPPA